MTHPQHPLCGSYLPLVRIQQRAGAELDLIVRLPDGTHAALAASCTDYPLLHPPQRAPASALLLDVEGLRQLAHVVAAVRAPQP